MWPKIQYFLWEWFEILYGFNYYDFYHVYFSLSRSSTGHINFMVLWQILFMCPYVYSIKAAYSGKTSLCVHIC